MKRLSFPVCFYLAAQAVSAHGSDAIDLGYVPGGGTLVSGGDPECGELVFSSDSSYENGYAWYYGGVAPPYFGAFAECYSGPLEVCAVVTDLTTNGLQWGFDMDLYVWDDAGGAPGAVIAAAFDVNAGPIAFWPSVSRHVLELRTTCTGPTWWIGWWGDWPGTGPGWWVGADLDGPRGCPFTNIAPGTGFPTGWHHVSIVWGPTSAIGIGAEVNPCEPVPTKEATWGRVKALYSPRTLGSERN